MALARQQPLLPTQSTGVPPSPPACPQQNGTACVLGDVKALLSGNSKRVTVNDVLQCAKQMDSSTRAEEDSQQAGGGGSAIMEPYKNDNSSFSRLVTLARQQPLLPKQSTGVPPPPPPPPPPRSQQSGKACVLGDVKALLSGNAKMVTVNDVLQCAKQRDSSTPAEEEEAGRGGGSAILEPYKCSAGVVVSKKSMAPSLTGTAPSVMIEPYDVRENIDRRDSLVSVSGIQSALNPSSAAEKELFIADSFADFLQVLLTLCNGRQTRGR
jgi:hypothetical protein